MRTAIIGLGVIGAVHINVLKSSNDTTIVAVCDVNQDKLNLYPEIAGYTDYKQMLDEVKPDVVHICTPHYLHAEMVIAALERDINVLCEKPLCIDKQDIPLILEAEKNSKAQLGVCFQNRYNISTLFVKEYLKNKEVLCAYGRMMWHRDQTYYNQAQWRGSKKYEGGSVLINQSLHTIDLLQWFMGMPNTVIGWCANVSLQDVIDTEDTATVICRGDKEFSILATNVAARDFPTEIVFKTTTDTIRMFPKGVFVNDTFYDFKGVDEVCGKRVYGNGHYDLINDFYDCVKTGRKFPIDGLEGAKAVKIVLSAYESKGEEIVCK